MKHFMNLKIFQKLQKISWKYRYLFTIENLDNPKKNEQNRRNTKFPNKLLIHEGRRQSFSVDYFKGISTNNFAYSGPKNS